MKILQIFGAVVAVHVLAFIFIFASPGCQSGPRNTPTPDATMPSNSDGSAPTAMVPVAYSSPANPQSVEFATPTVAYPSAPASGHATPTRPGSAAAVAVTPVKPVADVASVTTYTVGRGDSLWSIAKKNQLTVSELAKANNLPPGAALKPGRKLLIPLKAGAQPKDLATTPAAAAAPVVKPVAGTTLTSEGVKHTVQVGESLGVIARKYQVNVGELAAANNITDPSKVRAGQTLIIPGFKAVNSKSATPTVATPAKAGPPMVKTNAPAPKTAAAETPAPAPAGPHFDISPPPPGQDLDAGLKTTTPAEVPTIKVEDPANPPKN